MSEVSLAALISGAFGVISLLVGIWGRRLEARVVGRADAEAEAQTENSRLRRGIGMHIPICDRPTELIALLKPPTS